MDYTTTYEATSGMSTAGQVIYLIVVLALLVLMIVAEWKIFTKAGEKGWKCLIPFYNLYILVKIADGNGWKFLLFLIPIVGFIFGIMVDYRLAKSFGKGVGFTFGLIFLAEIFMPILGFGSAQYLGPKGPKAA